MSVYDEKKKNICKEWHYIPCECYKSRRPCEGPLDIGWKAWHVEGSKALQVAEIEVRFPNPFHYGYKTFFLIHGFVGTYFYLLKRDKCCRLHNNLESEWNRMLLEDILPACDANVFWLVLKEIELRYGENCLFSRRKMQG